MQFPRTKLSAESTFNEYSHTPLLSGPGALVTKGATTIGGGGTGLVIASGAAWNNYGTVTDNQVIQIGIAPALPKQARLNADSGYQGYDKDHANPGLPYKKLKGGELDEEEKQYNRGLGSFRVAVEHRIGRTKRFRILSDRFRNPRYTHHIKTSIIAGLVNIEAGFLPFNRSVRVEHPEHAKPRHGPKC